MGSQDDLIIDLINRLESGKNEDYKLFTVMPDLVLKSSFKREDNNNYSLFFVLPPEYRTKNVHDYFFQKPFILNSHGMNIVVQNHEILGVREQIVEDMNKSCNFLVTIKSFSVNVDDSLWNSSHQVAFIKYKEGDFKPYESSILFDLTTKMSDNGSYNALLLNISNNEFVFYYERINSETGYYIIKSKNIINHSDFKYIVESISSAYAFITGYYMLNTIYYLAVIKDSKNDIAVRYENINQQINTREPILDSGLYLDIPKERRYISSEQFNKLVNYLYSDENYYRTSTLLFNAGRMKGAMKASLAAVALETVTSQVIKGNTASKVINDKQIADSINCQLKEVLKTFKTMITKEQFTILSNKIDRINDITNISKLEDAFQILGISLNEDEKYCIKCRNNLLHGSLPKRKKDMWMTDSELLDIVANRLVMLSSMLLLKMASFEGFVIDRGMTDVVKWRMIKNGEKVRGGNILRDINE